MTELAPTQVALRELMILTKCYCVSYGVGEHPRLGHNCSFRPDVETLVRNIGTVLAMCNGGAGDGVWSGYVDAESVRAALLGLPVPEWPSEGEKFYPCEHGGSYGSDYCRLCEQTAPDEGPSTDDPPWRTEEAPGTG